MVASANPRLPTEPRPSEEEAVDSEEEAVDSEADMAVADSAAV